MKFGLNKAVLEKLRTLFSASPKIKRVVIFGSRAMGTQKNGSDIDLALLGEGLQSRDVRRLYGAMDKFYFPYKFDIVILKDVKEPALVEHIERVGKTIYP